LNRKKRRIYRSREGKKIPFFKESLLVWKTASGRDLQGRGGIGNKIEKGKTKKEGRL